MTSPQSQSIPVVDVDNAFPAMVERSGAGREAAAGDVAPQVTSILRDVLGWRPRSGDPQAFESALTAAFRLRMVEGHVEADYVPRGYAVQADLGAVTGGQASLYRRATLARTEALRILDGLTPLRVDADPQDMESYRLLVRNAVERVVDEMGAPGGPRVQMVDMYFSGLTGVTATSGSVSADTVSGQLGALRDRFGLVDGNVNTVEEEGIRTAFWTLVDMVTDLQTAWRRQVVNFSGGTGQGFLGTDLILLSRLMEAAADQVEELEDVLDSVLIAESERRTLVLDQVSGLTLDGLLSWLRDFLGQEGRRIAQDAGRDGIVAGLAPMAVALVVSFRKYLADPIATRAGALEGAPDGVVSELELRHARTPILYLPASCCDLPAGMFAARTRIAVAGLCRLLTDLARTAQGVGRFAQPVLVNVSFQRLEKRANLTEVRVRGFNLRSEYIPAFVRPGAAAATDSCLLEEFDPAAVLLPVEGTSTADDDEVAALFATSDLATIAGLRQLGGVDGSGTFVTSADYVPLTLIDGARGVRADWPEVVTVPRMQPADEPDQGRGTYWGAVGSTRLFQTTPTEPLVSADFTEPDETEPDETEVVDRLDAGLLTKILEDPSKEARLSPALNDAGYLLRPKPHSSGAGAGVENDHAE